MRKSHFPTSWQAALCPRYLLRQEMPTFCLCTKAYRPSISKLFGKTDFKRMRYPFHVILMALSMFYAHFAISTWFCGLWWISRSSTQPSATGVPVSPRCTKTSLYSSFRRSISTLTSGTPMKPSLRYREMLPLAHSGQWDALCLSPHRDSPQAFTILDAVKPMGDSSSHCQRPLLRSNACQDAAWGKAHPRAEFPRRHYQQPHWVLQQAV